MNAVANTPMTIQERPNAGLMLMNPAVMHEVYKFAELMAKGGATIPKHLQGNVADCMAVTMQALQWGMFPFAVAQKTHITPSGALGYEAQLISAVVTESGAVEGDPEYEFIGDWSKVLGKVEERKSDKGGKYYVATYTKADEHGLGVICRLRLKGEVKPREITVMMSQCYPRFSTQWATDPQMQICYVAIRKWTRRNKPGVILGIHTPDELEEISSEPRDINPAPESAAAAQPQQRTSGLSSSLKARSAANQPVTVEPVAELVTGDDDALIIDDEPALSDEAMKYEAMLMDCTEAEHFKDWKAQVQGKFPANSTDYVELVKAYNARRAQLTAQQAN